jgi:hypothetical protein
MANILSQQCYFSQQCLFFGVGEAARLSQQKNKKEKGKREMRNA